MFKKIVYFYLALVAALFLAVALSHAQIAIHKLYQTEEGIAVVQMSDAPLAVRPYAVTNAAAFPSLPLPARALIFRNGLFQTPGLHYDAVGANFRFRAGVLSNGDTVSVVTLP